MPRYFKRPYRRFKRRTFRRKYTRRYKKGGSRLTKQLRINGSNHLILKQKRVRNFSLDTTTVLPDVRQYTFQISDVPQVATLAELFDMYKINGVQWKLTLLQTTQGAPASCQVAIIKDYDGQSGATASTWNELLERANCKLKNLQADTTRNSCKAYITPKIANTVWSGAVASGYSTPKGKQWIDMGSTSVPYYSIIAGINPYQGTTYPAPGLSGTFVFQVETTYYLSLKQVR